MQNNSFITKQSFSTEIYACCLFFKSLRNIVRTIGFYKTSNYKYYIIDEQKSEEYNNAKH